MVKVFLCRRNQEKVWIHESENTRQSNLTALSNGKTYFCINFSENTPLLNIVPKIDLAANNVLLYCLKLFSVLLDWVAKLSENSGVQQTRE